MQKRVLIDLLQTPRKRKRLVLAPSYTKGEFDSHGVDCPFLFRHKKKFWMTYVGWDGVGYQTGLASSDDLECWHKEGLLISRGEKGAITEYNIALTSILRENDLFGQGTLRKVKGKFVGTYHAYPEPGYESGAAVIGLCYSDDLLAWEIGAPVLRPDPLCAWESGGLYKSWLLESEGVYYLFYNAKDQADDLWVEQTGFATSNDLLVWERCPENPILPVGVRGSFDDRFASDPCVLRHENMWIMFYFGLSSDGYAREGVALSDDLLHWQKTGQVLIDIGSDGSIDSRYAHKPGIINDGDQLYHFYCAVSPATKSLGDVQVKQIRGIALATKKASPSEPGLTEEV